MTTALGDLALTVFSFVGMELFTWAFHRYVMHGVGWGWHRSHHEGRGQRFEKNDLFAVVFAGIGIALFALGLSPALRACTFVGIGVTLYGALYFLVHDGLCHGRIKLPRGVPGAYLKRLIQAHRLHHATPGRDGAVSFGFLYVRDPRVLKRVIGERFPRRPEPLAP
jgi:beta-carotene 3-hydroxylase